MPMPDNCSVMVPNTPENIDQLIREAFNRSRPQGMGFLHHQPGEITDEELAFIKEHTARGRQVFSMDYVRGRSCKFHVYKSEDEQHLLLDPRWYDHSDEDLYDLLKTVGIEEPESLCEQVIANRQRYYAEQEQA